MADRGLFGFRCSLSTLDAADNSHYVGLVSVRLGNAVERDAEDVMALLRDHHAPIGEIIIKYNGTLEYADDVMVVFNDPVPVENLALHAVLMALEMRDAILFSLLEGPDEFSFRAS